MLKSEHRKCEYWINQEWIPGLFHFFYLDDGLCMVIEDSEGEIHNWIVGPICLRFTEPPKMCQITDPELLDLVDKKTRKDRMEGLG